MQKVNKIRIRLVLGFFLVSFLVLFIRAMQLTVLSSIHTIEIRDDFPGPFEVSYQATGIIGDESSISLRENYRIISKHAVYKNLDISEIETGLIPESSLLKYEKLQCSECEGDNSIKSGKKCSGIEAEFQRKVDMPSQKIGFMLSRVKLDIPDITLTYDHPLFKRDPKDSYRYKWDTSQTVADRFQISPFDAERCQIKVQLPKCSFLYSDPPASYTSLPDNDMIEIKLMKDADAIYIYFLSSALRFEIVRKTINSGLNMIKHFFPED